MQPIINYIKHPNQLLIGIVKRSRCFLSDSMYLRMLYYLKMGQRLHLNHPQKFTEKIQWLKLYNRKVEYTMMVDKIKVKEYVSGIIDSSIVVPLIRIFNTPSEIILEDLPNQFVLKTNHSGGNTGVVVCKDKSKFDLDSAIEKLTTSMSNSAYDIYLEWPYKDVERKVFAEEYLEDETGYLMDYKFMCFNGEPKFVHICPDRNLGGPIHFDYYDLDWNKLPFTIEHPNSEIIVAKPKSFDKMLEYSRILSKNIPLARIDFYEVKGQPYFGEITFYPYSGMERFDKEEWNKTLGSWINLT